MSQQSPVTPRPASAVVLAREHNGGGIEVFMVRRHVRSEFVPDAYVFPGGSVKPTDIEDERAPAVSTPIESEATALGTGFRAAALRECFEEAGVLLARRGSAPLSVEPGDISRFAAYRDGLINNTLTLAELCAREELTLATDELLHWAHWITPLTFPKRFDTHFFLTEMPSGQEAAHDQLETTASIWITPEEALTRYEAGDFTLVFATIHQLRALSGLASVAAARKRFSGAPPRTIMPRVVERNGQEVILLPDED